MSSQRLPAIHLLLATAALPLVRGRSEEGVNRASFLIGGGGLVDLDVQTPAS